MSRVLEFNQLKAKLSFTNTDSLKYGIENRHVYQDFYDNIQKIHIL